MRSTGNGPLGLMDDLPPLGPAGEGWVAIQSILELGILCLAMVTNGAWAEPMAGAALVIGALICAAGVGLFAFGAVTLGASFSIWVKPRAHAHLVRRGPYRWMRHPVCTAQVVFGIGWALVWQSIVALILVAVLAWYLDRFKLEREEQWLVTTYPEYDAYRRAVPHRMLPQPPSHRGADASVPRAGPPDRS